MNRQVTRRNQESSSGMPAPTGVLQRKCNCGNHGLGRQCGVCGKNCTGMLQRKPADLADINDAPPIVHDALRAPGYPLDLTTRAFFEPRFDHDFSRVRMHTDAKAAESARAVNALAYTVGRDVVFGAGQYTPGTRAGNRLLAHELAHTIQQSPGIAPQTIPVSLQPKLTVSQQGDEYEREADRAAKEVLRMQEPATATHTLISLPTSDAGQMIQRTPEKLEKKEARRDVVFILSPDVGSEAPVVAPEVKPIRVSSPEDMAAKLKQINYPIKSLFIISHALPSGDLGFGTRDSLTFVLPSKVAAALKGSMKPEYAPELLDFRGCTIGQSPKAMEEMRAAVGAGATVGGNCYLVSQKNGPIALGGKRITKASYVTSANRKDFEKGLQMLIDSFGPKKACILNKSETGYFQAGGVMVAQWFSPELSEEWDERKSKCYAALRMEPVDPAKAKSEEFNPGIVGHCRLIKVERPK